MRYTGDTVGYYADEWYDEHEDEIREALALEEADLVNGRLIWESDTEGEE